MHTMLLHYQSQLWARVAPLAAGAAAVGLVHCSLPEAPSSSCCDLLVSPCTSAAAALSDDIGGPGMLLGRGDPKTKRGKVFKGSFGKSRPWQKTDWKEWSQSQLPGGVPERPLRIPQPPAHRRTSIAMPSERLNSHDSQEGTNAEGCEDSDSGGDSGSDADNFQGSHSSSGSGSDADSSNKERPSLT